jgi:hypothetical protein
LFCERSRYHILNVWFFKKYKVSEPLFSLAVI